jgi:hypothetical protein
MYSTFYGRKITFNGWIGSDPTGLPWDGYDAVDSYVTLTKPYQLQSLFRMAWDERIIIRREIWGWSSCGREVVWWCSPGGNEVNCPEPHSEHPGISRALQPQYQLVVGYRHYFVQCLRPVSAGGSAVQPGPACGHTAEPCFEHASCDADTNACICDDYFVISGDWTKCLPGKLTLASVQVVR